MKMMAGLDNREELVNMYLYWKKINPRLLFGESKAISNKFGSVSNEHLAENYTVMSAGAHL